MVISDRWRHALPWIAAIGIATLVVWQTSVLIAANWNFTTDDAYITLRYARNLAEGHGVVWNIGETPPVEGYSNFSFVLLGAAALELGLDPIVTFKVAGVVALAATCVTSWLLARCWLGPVGAAIPALVLTHYVGTVFWTTSGLETPVFQSLVVGAVAAFAWALRRSRTEPGALPSPRLLLLAGLLAFLASITRPEGPLVAVGIGIGLSVHLSALSDTPWRSRVRVLSWFLLAFAVPYCAYFGWRWLHFERLLPNTVYCKSQHGEGSLQIISDYGELAWPYVVLALAHDWRKRDPRVIVLLAIPLLYAITLVNVDPIIGMYNRHALTAWALLLVGASIGFVNLLSLVPGLRAGGREWVAAGLALIWVTGSMRVDPWFFEAHAKRYVARELDRKDVGEWLRAHVGLDEEYVIGDCGVIPYIGRGKAIDAFCLNNRDMTRPPIDGSRVRFVEHVLASAPAWIVVHSRAMDRLNPRPEYGFYANLIAHPAFAHYKLVTKIAARQRVFVYWIYRRR